MDVRLPYLCFWPNRKLYSILNFPLFILMGQTLFKDVECYSRSECGSSSFIAFDTVETPKECHQFCIEQDNFSCNYFTHYKEEDTGACFAYTDCVEVLDVCLDCVSGSVDCPLLGEVSSVIEK